MLNYLLIGQSYAKFCSPLFVRLKFIFFSISILTYQGQAFGAPKIITPTFLEVVNRNGQSFENQSKLQQLYNTGQERTALKKDFQNQIDVDLYLIPEADMEKYEVSTNLGDEVVSFFKTKIKGKNFIRFPVHPDNTELKLHLSKKYTIDTVRIHATYMMSGRTFFCWSEFISVPFFLKLDGMPSGSSPRRLGITDIYSSVLTTKVFLKENFNFLPEPFGASIRAFDSGFQLRLFTPNRPLSPASVMVPAHTFFDPVFFNELIKTSSSPKSKIISSLIDTFAEFIVKSFFKAGAGVAAHNQNTWLVYNRDTGIIEDVVIQDLGDVLFDDDLRRLNNKEPITKIRLRFEHALAVAGRELLEGKGTLQEVFNNYALQFLDEVELQKDSSWERFVKVLEMKIKEHFKTGKRFYVETNTPFRAVDEIASFLKAEKIHPVVHPELCKSIFR